MIISRFAPSPTGALHVGGARTALFCWAIARRARLEGGDGRFVLRIEDTDQKRSSDDASLGILRDLAWLGIDWDEGPEFVCASEGERRTLGGDPRAIGPFHQSDRITIYDAFIERLIEDGHAYPAFETPEQLDAMRAEAQAQKKTFVYRKPEGFDRGAARDRARAEAHVVRLAMPPVAITVHDAILGDVTFPYEELDDFVIRKRDGFPTYHLAVVVDDELMGVTHVMRGQEHLNNTPRHLALMRALTHEDGRAFRTPTMAHMPTIANPDGSKMSKRDRDKTARAHCRQAGIDALPAPLAGRGVLDASDFDRWLGDKTYQLEPAALVELAREVGVELPEVSVADFKASGYLPGVLCNYLALLGWNSGEKHEDGRNIERFDMAWLAERFSVDRVGKSASRFDRAKLLSFNAETIQQMDPADFARTWRAWLTEYDPAFIERFGEEPRFRWVCAAAQPRARTLRDARDPLAFAMLADDQVEFDPKAVEKALRKGEPSGLAVLAKFEAEVLDAWGDKPWTPEAIEHAIAGFCERAGLGMGKIAQPLRVAVTGGMVSPGMGETLGILGRASVLARVQRCLQLHSA